MEKSQIEWKRSLNQLRFLHRELQLIEEIIEMAAPGFQKYYRQFCDEHDLSAEEGALGLEATGPITAVGEVRPDAVEPPTEEETPTPPSADETETKNEMTEAHKAFVKLFRALAMLLHPDRLPPETSLKEKLQKLDLFKTANEAIETKQYFKLLQLAEKFDIEIPAGVETELDWLLFEAQAVNDKIQKLKGTYNYRFSACKTEEDKEALLKRFIKQLFDIDL